MLLRDILRGARRIEAHSETCSHALTMAFLNDIMFRCSALACCEDGEADSFVESLEESMSAITE